MASMIEMFSSEGLMQCPLNPNHVIKSNRLVAHLSKCENNIQCPINPKHRVQRKNLQNHLLKCEKEFPYKVCCPYGHLYYLTRNEMVNHIHTCPHKPKKTQAEEMQANPPRIENNHIQSNILKYCVQSHHESRDSSPTVSVPTVDECRPHGYQFGSTMWD